MDYLDEFDLVGEDAAGYPGSSPLMDDIGLDDFPSDFGSSIRESSAAEGTFVDDLELHDFDDNSEHDDDDREEAEDSDDDQDSLDEISEEAGISFDSWDNGGGDNESSPRSSSPSDSVDLSLIDTEHIQDTDQDDQDEEDLRSVVSLSSEARAEPREAVGRGLQAEREGSLSIGSDFLQGRLNLWEQQHRDLAVSHQRISDSLRELAGQRVQERSRFWHDTLSRQRERGPIHRSSTMSSSAGRTRPAVSPSPPRPQRDVDALRSARRAERRRNEGFGASTGMIQDELVQVEVEGPQISGRGQSQSSRRRQTQSSGGPQRTRPVVPGRPPAAAFIDLTEEPDSPESHRNGNGPSATNSRAGAGPSGPFNQFTLPSISTNTTRHSNNPRRQMSLNHRTPSLTRSDGSLLGNRTAPPPQADVIDLTMDDDPPAPARPNNRPPVSRRHNRQFLPAIINPIDVDEERSDNTFLGILHRIGFGIGTAFFGNTTAVTIDMQAVPDPLGGNRPNFNYQANGYNSGGRTSSKPVHEPPAKAREGFSRNTGSAGEDAFVCPACEEELAYDPDEEGPASPGKGGPPPKRARTKKDREEHHFWAVKECGHVSVSPRYDLDSRYNFTDNLRLQVFCKKCYEGRKPTKANKSKFRTDPEHPRRVICAVDDCKSDVSNKTAWVGLFL